MNKFKKVLLGALSVLTLGLFVVTGAKVNAATSTYNANEETGNIAKNGTNPFATKTLFNLTSGSKDITLGTAKSDIHEAASNYTYTFTKGLWVASTTTSSGTGIKVTALDDNISFKFYYTISNSSKFSNGEYNAGGMNIWDSTGSEKTGYIDTSTIQQTTYSVCLTQEYTITTKNDYVWLGTTANRLVLLGVEASGGKTSAEYISEAESAISAIETVTYTQTCKEAIDAAKTAIDACVAQSIATSSITNYSTYTDADTSFTNLSTTAKNTFINSVNVDDITTISASSKQALKTANTNYNNLIASDKLDADVVAAKATLDEKQAEYSAAYEKIMSITIDGIDGGVKTNTNIASDTVLTVSSKDSIFSATPTVKIEDSSSGKSYDSVTYNDRFKTNGTIQILDSNVNCALKIEAPSTGTIELLALSGNINSLRNIKLCKVVNNALVTVKDLGNVAQKSTLDKFTFNIYEAGTYYIGSDTVENDNDKAAVGGINIYKVTFTEYDFIDSTVTATLYKQFDKDSNPTMLRLMGKIEGIAYADYAKISNVLMEFDFYNGTNTSSKSAYCYKLYKSINTLDDSLGADEDGKTMYVVLTISGLEKYQTKSFTNVKMTITFSDGSTKEATHANF